MPPQRQPGRARDGRFEQWPRPLLQSLRCGNRRLGDRTSRLIGASFARIRTALDRLPPAQARALHRAVRDGIGFADTRAVAQWSVAAAQRGLPRHAEAVLLEFAGRDRYGRRHWLQPGANRAWRRLRDQARSDGIELELISSYRSVRDQMRILERKRNAGQSWEQILAVNAPPGYSEHHTGCAIDLAVPGEAPLTESFEHTGAFRWLLAHAQGFGFELSYPRGNPCGFIYEPWHWCYRPAAGKRRAPPTT